MPSNQLPQPGRVRASDLAFVALSVAGLLVLIVAVHEITLYKPSHQLVLGIDALVLTSDACLFFAWWYGGLVVRVTATLCGLVALVNTFAMLRYTLQNFS